MPVRRQKLKRLILATAMAVITVSVSASSLTVTDKAGKKVGSATFSMKTGSGRITHTLNMTFKQQGATITLNTTSAFSTSGNPLSTIMKMSAKMQDNAMTNDINVTFAGKKATLVAKAMGQSKTKSATAPGSVTDKSVVWMAGKIPAAGTSSVHYSFSPMEGSWRKTTVKYHGTRSVKLSKGTVTAHVLTEVSDAQTTKVYFTAKGDLLRLEAGDFTASQ